MLSSIELRNFRGFKSFHAPVGAVTAVAGRNSSGKTSLLQAVRLACDALSLALEEAAPAKVDGQAVVRADARTSPAVWQPGKKRASFVLDRVRKALPGKARSTLSGSLIDLIERAPIDRLGDPEKLVPKEIRDLLDLMISP